MEGQLLNGKQRKRQQHNLVCATLFIFRFEVEARRYCTFWCSSLLCALFCSAEPERRGCGRACIFTDDGQVGEKRPSPKNILIGNVTAFNSRVVNCLGS